MGASAINLTFVVRATRDPASCAGCTANSSGATDMRAVVVGTGRMGTLVKAELEARGHEVVGVDRRGRERRTARHSCRRGSPAPRWPSSSPRRRRRRATSSGCSRRASPVVSRHHRLRRRSCPHLEHVARQHGALLHRRQLLGRRAPHAPRRRDARARLRHPPRVRARIIVEMHHSAKLDAPSGTGAHARRRPSTRRPASTCPITSRSAPARCPAPTSCASRARHEPVTLAHDGARPRASSPPAPSWPPSGSAGRHGSLLARRRALREGRMTTLRGCGTAIVTPFTDAGRIDEAALAALVEWQVEEGIDFLVPCGSTGEAQTLTTASARASCSSPSRRRAVACRSWPAPASNDTAPRRRGDDAHVRRGRRRHPDARRPYYNKPTQDGLLPALRGRRRREQPAGGALQRARPQRSQHAARHRGHAGRARNASSPSRRRAATCTRRSSCSGSARTASASSPATTGWPCRLIACGGDGLISVASNEMPGAMARLVRHALAGELAAARALHGELHAAARRQLHRVQPDPGEGGARAHGPHPQRAPASARAGGSHRPSSGSASSSRGSALP